VAEHMPWYLHPVSRSPISPPSAGTSAAPIGRLVMPGPGARATTVCGAYLLQRHRSHPLLKSLPDVLHLTA